MTIFTMVCIALGYFIGLFLGYYLSSELERRIISKRNYKKAVERYNKSMEDKYGNSTQNIAVKK